MIGARNRRESTCIFSIGTQRVLGHVASFLNGWKKRNRRIKLESSRRDCTSMLSEETDCEFVEF
jgi:hypothetical protein